ncbi:Oidioi.mRNA.OKI2018_I69.XSR.g14886.t1.cds [Oikopleura dioica]|uniref:Oidioi.mRNA.OKI2018_I69.XSR.g14886.t1.cds n=1 Tax=Oikopleura dioica TaxID=34765 RepID=A0ABN7SB37_OIKDI|nr:Oidioi.mRNA.OKI2018_I69.XSR.g14886.t1.cds [Oikopleura dioica]
MSSRETSYIAVYADDSTLLALNNTPPGNQYTPSFMVPGPNFLQDSFDETIISVPDTTTDYSTADTDRSTFGTRSVTESENSRADSTPFPEGPNTTPVDVPDVSTIPPPSLVDNDTSRNEHSDVSSPTGFTLPPINEEDSIEDATSIHHTMSVIPPISVIPSVQMIWDKTMSVLPAPQNQRRPRVPRRNNTAGVQQQSNSRRFYAFLLFLIFVLLTSALAFLIIRVTALQMENASLAKSLKYKKDRNSELADELRDLRDKQQHHEETFH